MMFRSVPSTRSVRGARPLVAALAFLSLVVLAQARSEAPTPNSPTEGGRVIVLGFDGASHHLAEKFMAEGLMPNSKRLMEQGTFAPLGSANPAESPVAWASINTGCNPGKTNIFGFLRRTLKGPFPIPTIGYSREIDVPFTSNGGASMGSGAKTPAEGESGQRDLRLALLLGAGAFVVGFALLRFVLKVGGGVALPVAVLIALGAAYLSGILAKGAPWLAQEGYTMPTHKNDLSVPNFWDYLDQAGKTSRILQAACTYPATGGENTHLLTGLSTPDVAGGPGTWFIYTNSDWAFDDDTSNGGKLIKYTIRNQEEGTFTTRLEGPEEFYEEQRRLHEIEDLKAEAEAEKDAKAKAKLNQRVRSLNFKLSDWRSKNKHARLELKGKARVADRAVDFEIQGQTLTLKEGEWSDYIPLTFDLQGAFPIHATCRVHLSLCNPEAEEVRFYVPAITVAADQQPPNMQVTSPASFGKDLVDGAGHFDTIGWSCQTNAFKDKELEIGSFMSEIWETIEWRRRMLLDQVAEEEWNVLFQVFGTTDRVAHMTYRWYDQEHPLYDEAEANEMVTFGDRQIAVKDAIPAVYEEMDKTIGLVMERMDNGSLGEDVTLMVIADHGFSSFREEVDLNGFLIESGFLAVATDEATGEPVTSSNLLPGRTPSYVDWSKTKAYSMGIGTIYLNLKGREANGIVEPEDYDQVCEDIFTAMKAYQNPNQDSTNDPQVFRGAWKRSQYLAGPHAQDVYVEDEEGNRTCSEGPADIQVGFNWGYRVGWGNALGERETKRGVVFPNENRWSGDHTTVHPYLVRGVFFSNKKMGTWDPHLQDIAPTILALQGVDVPADMDGWVLPLTGLEAAAQSHQGGKANRESLMVPAW